LANTENKNHNFDKMNHLRNIQGSLSTFSPFTTFQYFETKRYTFIFEMPNLIDVS